MSFKCKKPLQTITFFLFFCLANSSVFAFIPDGNVSADTTAQKVSYTGILNAADPLSVRVNGNIAQDGMTILSGAEVKTGNNGGAVIKIHQLGKIELSGETSVKLAFSAQNVDVQIVSGQAVLTTYKGVKGKLSDANGKVLMTDSTLEISSIENSAVALSPETTVAAPTLFGFGFWGTIGLVVTGTVVTWLAVTQLNNDPERSISSVQP